MLSLWSLDSGQSLNILMQLFILLNMQSKSNQESFFHLVEESDVFSRHQRILTAIFYLIF